MSLPRWARTKLLLEQVVTPEAPAVSLVTGPKKQKKQNNKGASQEKFFFSPHPLKRSTVSGRNVQVTRRRLGRHDHGPRPLDADRAWWPRHAWADTTTAQGRLMLTVLGGLAEFPNPGS